MKEFNPYNAYDIYEKYKADYSKAKGYLAGLGEKKKMIVAIMMKKSNESSLGAQEREAYASAEFEKYCNDKHNYKKVIFIVAHVFSDAPHSASKMLYDDYYQWLLSTLNIIKKNPNVLWVVKPHPASKVYNEEGIVSDMISTLGVMNIRTSPPNLNVKSLINIADAIVTVLGTAGLEFSCFGIPSVLAGLPFYGGKGFTIDCETIEAYENTLLNIENVMPLTENQVQKALEIYSLWDAQFDWENPIITSEVLKYVWGSGVDANLNNAYDLINANLLNNNPMDLRLWKFCQANL